MANDIELDGVKAVEALREAVEKHGASSHEAKQIAENTQKSIDAMEEKNQQVVAQFAKAQNELEDLKERYNELELAVIDASKKGGSDFKNTEEYKTLNFYAKNGKSALDSEQKAILRTDNGVQGGYLTMTEMDSAIIKKITEISPVRQIARVRTIGSKALEIPTRQTIPTAAYEGETETANESTSTYGAELLTPYRLAVTVPFTIDLLNDSEFDLETEIQGDVAEAFAQAEGNKFVLGTGAKQPEGFLTNADLIAGARTSTGGSGVIDADDLILMSGDLKVGYNAMYGFNRRTLATFRTFKGSDGQYLWQAGLGGGAPNTIAGMPYVLLEDMPDIAANSLSVVYADFGRGYRIVDRTGMGMIRDEFTQAKQAIVNMTFMKWNHGQVVLPEAFKLLKTQA